MSRVLDGVVISWVSSGSDVLGADGVVTTWVLLGQ